MPDCNFVILDTVTGLCLTSYSTRLENCLWGNEGFICFETDELAKNVIATWGDYGERFQSSNPPNPPHH